MRGLPNAANITQTGTLRLAVLAFALSHDAAQFIVRERHATSTLPWVADLEQVSNAGEEAVHELHLQPC